MRTIETALWPLEKPAADVGVGVFLGEAQTPGLADLIEDECVLLVEPNELRAEGTVRRIEVSGRQWWFAEIADPDAIEVIYPEPAARSCL
jgi:hypothetical protein